MSRLKSYEILIIIDPRRTDEEVAADVERLGEQLRGLGAEVAGVDPWGRRRLTFDIKKQREGSYVVLSVLAEPAAMREFERQTRLNETILRFMSTRTPKPRRLRGRAAEAPAAPEAPTLVEAAEPTA